MLKQKSKRRECVCNLYANRLKRNDNEKKNRMKMLNDNGVQWNAVLVADFQSFLLFSSPHVFVVQQNL